jgi:cystathionine beta-synthase
LKPVTSIAEDSPCDEAIETMREKAFDQLPVSSKSQKLVGLVTLGNLLSYISSGRAEPNDPVSKVMFDFTRMDEIVTDPTDIGQLILEEKKDSGKSEGKQRKFVEITRDTPLSALSRFFEWNSAAVVTERSESGLKAVAIVTKVDLLSWMVRMKKHHQL